MKQLIVVNPSRHQPPGKPTPEHQPLNAWMLCGVAAPLVYLVAVVLGGALRPDYSHLAQPVSDLIAVGAPNKRLLDALFTGYNLLTAALGVGLLGRVRDGAISGARSLGRAGAVVLVGEGVFGFMTLFFPEDAEGLGSAISTTGLLHIVFAGLSSLSSMLAVLLGGLWLKSSPRWACLGRYSLWSVGAIFVSGGLAALLVARHSELGGLVERLTIGGFLQWVLVLGWAMRRA